MPEAVQASALVPFLGARALEFLGGMWRRDGLSAQSALLEWKVQAGSVVLS
jgi:hypothetical protein